MDAWASFPGQEVVELPNPDLFPRPSSWTDEGCYQAYDATVGNSEDAQLQLAAAKTHADCLIKAQFNECLDPRNSPDDNSKCFKEVVFAQKWMIIEGTIQNAIYEEKPFSRPELEELHRKSGHGVCLQSFGCV